MNYVFYVCDSMPQSGHFRKMDAEYEIATHIKNGLKNCIVKKYTEYEGNIIDAQSVGVVSQHIHGEHPCLFILFYRTCACQKIHICML